jgi:hypothetical protein
MSNLTTAWMLGCVCGFFLGVTVASRRRPTCRELMRERQPTFADLLITTGPPRLAPQLQQNTINQAGHLRSSCDAAILSAWMKAAPNAATAAAGPPRLSHQSSLSRQAVA